jgi:nondiscriminating glutamyl-tRNA synthetase
MVRPDDALESDAATPRPIRVRIAPSPTGPLHIGTARTSLFNLLYARRHGGTFVLRLEDTDVVRSELAYEKDILEGLHWLGITWDEGPEVAGEEAVGPYGPYRQSERLASYETALARLLETDRAYPCYCSTDELEADRKAQQAAGEPPRYVGRCAALTSDERAEREARGLKPVIRFRVAERTVTFHDLVRGDITSPTSAFGGDFVIARSDGSPLYHFAVVVDDAAMEISHIIRGEDHVSNTPKHILLFEALGAPVPEFAHLPLILNPDRTKMSKRMSQTSVADYIAQGFVREALVNYLALLGWSPGTEEELFTLDELGRRFDLDRVQQAGAIFDRQRLEWLNGQWIRRLADDELVARLMPFLEAHLVVLEAAGSMVRHPTGDDVAALLPMVRERLPTLAAIGELVDFLFVEEIAADPDLIVPKRWDRETTAEALQAARAVVADVGAVSYEADELEPPLRELAEKRGWKAGDLFMAIRVAVTGRTATPPLFDTLVALGYERTLERLDRAIEAVSSATGAVTPPTGGHTPDA